MGGDVDGERVDDVVDELAARRWKRAEEAREASTFPDAEVGPDRRETPD
jgi:hypothetical protein